VFDRGAQREQAPTVQQQRNQLFERGAPRDQGQAVPQQRGPGGDRGRPNDGNFNSQARPGGPGGERGNRQVIRPQDRVDRDHNRPRYDRRNWNFQNRANHHYRWRGPAYVLPYGFYAHSWAYGEVLPWGWYTPNYYIDDWSYYGLEPPPYGYEWVREGNDALLVDIYTGRVVSVEYGLFF
jgi:Ni/Co efflux regulator RcnB